MTDVAGARSDEVAYATHQATIKGQVAQITRLIGDLVEGSGIGAGKFRLERKLMDVGSGNLLENSSRYTPAGGKISFSASTVGDCVVIAVKDNGMGISATKGASRPTAAVKTPAASSW